MLNEYIVGLKEGIDYDAFWHEIETNGSGSTFVPDRGVNIVNERPLQGGSPGCSSGVITVGNVLYVDPTLGYPQQKSPDSESGSRVDIWAPGSLIVSTMSTTNAFGCTALYPPNTSFRIGSISRTSMAAPQIAGLCAQLLQTYPTCTPAQIRAKVIADSTANVLYSTGSSTDYDVSYSLHGGPNNYAYQPFNTSTNSNMSGAITMTNVTINT